MDTHFAGTVTNSYLVPHRSVLFCDYSLLYLAVQLPLRFLLRFNSSFVTVQFAWVVCSFGGKRTKYPQGTRPPGFRFPGPPLFEPSAGPYRRLPRTTPRSLFRTHLHPARFVLLSESYTGYFCCHFCYPAALRRIGFLLVVCFFRFASVHRLDCFM